MIAKYAARVSESARSHSGADAGKDGSRDRDNLAVLVARDDLKCLCRERETVPCQKLSARNEIGALSGSSKTKTATFSLFRAENDTGHAQSMLKLFDDEWTLEV